VWGSFTKGNHVPSEGEAVLPSEVIKSKLESLEPAEVGPWDTIFAFERSLLMYETFIRASLSTKALSRMSSSDVKDDFRGDSERARSPGSRRP
jgi:hypothetical protein